MKRQFKWDKKYLHWGVTAFLVITGSIVFFLIVSRLPYVWSAVNKIIGILSPVIYGLVFAYLLNKMMAFFENKFLIRAGRRLFRGNGGKAGSFARITGVILTFLCMLLIVGGTLALVLPQIYNSVQLLINQLPGYYDDVAALSRRFLAANPDMEELVVRFFGSVTDSLTNWLTATLLEQTDQIITSLTSGVLSVLKEIVSIIIGFIVSVYVLYHKEKFTAQCKRLVYGFFKPKRSNGILKTVRFLDKTVGGFILGKLIEAFIVGIITYIFMVVFGMPYGALIAVLVGLTTIIPFFGPFIGGIPSVLMILLESPVKCFIFLIFLVILHVLDANVLSPKIQSNTVGLSGFWVLFSILLFGGLFGFVGLLLGVPIFAVIYASIRDYNKKQLEEKNYPYLTEEYERILSIDADTGTPVYDNPEARDIKSNDREPSGRHGK
ncbi:MAG: AI-2E family transporter [Clostridiales bacterium]|nr:AI-2E family transporter [Clostridiales bacterium]